MREFFFGQTGIFLFWSIVTVGLVYVLYVCSLSNLSIFAHWNSHIFAIALWFICRLKLAYSLLAYMSALLYVILVDVGSAEFT